MKDNISKYIKWFLYLLLIFSFGLGIYYLLGTDLDDRSNSIYDVILWYSYILILVTAAIAIIAPAINLIFNPKGAVNILIAVLIMVIIWFISYGLASDALTIKQSVELGITAGTSKIVGAGLYFTYITLGLAVLSIIGTSVIRIFK
ncbi:MAG: hypothetical protein ACEPOV_00140 [Hyphomicrobiales bacterium]